jgi:hypothetical protein
MKRREREGREREKVKKPGLIGMLRVLMEKNIKPNAR